MTRGHPSGSFRFHVRLLGCALWLVGHAGAFSARPRAMSFLPPHHRAKKRSRNTATNSILTRSAVADHYDYHYRHREADVWEQCVGGARYELNELPDSMVPLTVYVGNLSEFVQDSELAALFATVSALNSVPACVVRKPDMSSRRYGFVSFPTAAEKDAAILRFHGVEFHGLPLKVEAVLPRVRIPESMIAYVSGDSSRRRRRRRASGRKGSTTAPRSSNTLTSPPLSTTTNNNKNMASTAASRATTTMATIARDDRKPRWNTDQQAVLDRAYRRGFLTLSTSSSHSSKVGRKLTQAHWRWCASRGKPQIQVVQQTSTARRSATHGNHDNIIDQVVVDLSPLCRRRPGVEDSTTDSILQKQQHYRADLFTAASATGMRLCGHAARCSDDSQSTQNHDDGSSASGEDVGGLLPPLVFRGERHQAKALAKRLAEQWDTVLLSSSPLEGTTCPTPSHARSAKKKKKNPPVRRRRQQQRQRTVWKEAF